MRQPRQSSFHRTHCSRQQRIVLLFLAFFGPSLMFGPKLSATEIDTRERPAQRTKLRPVIFIVLDTTRLDHLSAYGYRRPTTPFIDKRILPESVQFTKFIAASNNTSCSHASLFTGLYVQNHGVFTLSPKGYPLDEMHSTLAEILQDAGYYTVAAVSAAHLNPEHSGFGQGFEHFLSCPLDPETTKRPAEETTGAVATRLHDAYLKNGETRPLFLWMHYFDPHRKYSPPADLAEKFDPDDVIAKKPEHPEGFFLSDRGEEAERDSIAKQISLYDAEIRRADRAIENLFSVLEEIGQLEEAVVVVTADHGENLGEKSLYYNHAGLFDHVVRAPLLLRVPGMTSRRRSNALVHHIDILPTILDVVEVDRSKWPETDGKSFRKILEGEDRDNHPHVFTDASNFREKSVFDGRFKLIYDEPHDKTYLFDLNQDPTEYKNLSDSESEVVSRLMSLLTQEYVGLRKLSLVMTAANRGGRKETIRGSLKAINRFDSVTPDGFSKEDTIDLVGSKKTTIEFGFTLGNGERKGIVAEVAYGAVLMTIESDGSPIESQPVWYGEKDPDAVKSLPIILNPWDGLSNHKRAQSRRKPVALFERIVVSSDRERFRLSFGNITYRARYVTFRLGTNGEFSELECKQGTIGYRRLGGTHSFRVGSLDPAEPGIVEFDVSPAGSLVIVEGQIGPRHILNTEYRIGNRADAQAYPTTFMLTPSVSIPKLDSEEFKKYLSKPGFHLWFDFEGRRSAKDPVSPKMKALLSELGYLGED